MNAGRLSDWWAGSDCWCRRAHWATWVSDSGGLRHTALHASDVSADVSVHSDQLKRRVERSLHITLATAAAVADELPAATPVCRGTPREVAVVTTEGGGDDRGANTCGSQRRVINSCERQLV